MRITTFIPVFVLMALSVHSQELKQIYDPDSNAEKVVNQAIEKAKKENKHVFIQVGFNRCPWCRAFHKFINQDKEIDSIIQANYVKAKIYYGKSNQNPKMMKRLEYPNRFGFPVFVILDATGRRIHTQNSAYLEEGKGYKRKEVIKFFKQWSPTALDPASYK